MSQNHQDSLQLDNRPSNRKTTFLLTIEALGIVFGDIGTSPLYAFRECLASKGLAIDIEHILGILSLIIWTLILVVCVKYLAFVIRADNRDEGGILSLTNLVRSLLKKKHEKTIGLTVFLGILGASLLYSDGILTPAVSVLSAIEGLETVWNGYQPYILPIALAVLLLLFSVQSRGTAKVGKLFGPILLLWFMTIGTLGALAIAQYPQILQALNPWYALQFILHNGVMALTILGAVFLAITGAEVLYADLGHFGRSPIRRSWFFIVFPMLLLNYMGQGALVLRRPETMVDPFYQLAPLWFQLPLVILATMATVIASQAVISGAFSLARQSIQLGFWPRMMVKHTSSHIIGQIYVPFINWVLLLGTMALVLGFKKSESLLSAYGIAISMTMLITWGLMIFVMIRVWKWRWFFTLPIGLLFLMIDVFFFIANFGKIFLGGWIVILITVSVALLMTTWLQGRNSLRKTFEKNTLNIDLFIESIGLNRPVTVQGTAVFLTANPKGVPLAFLHNLRHNKVLHEHTFLVSVLTDELPKVPLEEKATIISHGQGIWQIVLHFGFSESPNIPQTLQALKFQNPELELAQATFFLGRESLVISSRKKNLSLWQKKLFCFMSHNALDATKFFGLPPGQVIEISAQTEL